MTWYAVDDRSGRLICVWGSGRGYVARTVTRSRTAAADTMLALSDTLSVLSEQLWMRYVLAPWDTQAQQESARVVGHIRKVVDGGGPGHTTDGDGAVQRAATQAANALRIVGEIQFRAAVLDDFRYEIQAIERADLGDLSGRASQATLLSRIAASPTQLRAAEDSLRRQPFGSPALREQVDPTAAATAAALWLHAAALVAAQASGIYVGDILTRADDIQAVPFAAPGKVLELLEAGLSAATIVADLIKDALAAQRGKIRRLRELEEALSQAKHHAEPYLDSDPRIYDAIRSEVRVCLLDPVGPSPALLVDLLAAIYGCWLVYREYGGGIDASEVRGYEPESLEGRRACFLDDVRQRRDQLRPL